MRPVHGAVVQVQKVSAAQFGQQGGMQTGPDAGLGPVPQPAPGRHPGAAHGLGRNIAPSDTSPQHVQDAREGRPVRNPKSTRVATAPFGSRRQQRSHPLPQVIRNKISTHSEHPADQDHRAQDPRWASECRFGSNSGRGVGLLPNPKTSTWPGKCSSEGRHRALLQNDQADPRLDRPETARSLGAADNWTWLIIAAYTQLRLARPPGHRPSTPMGKARPREQTHPGPGPPRVPTPARQI
ncbi:hypothetical protein QFZ56_007843 [Streptomyces achromogenes]|uniref:Uncharacterized protein n=1 Tax=Streptomyces achromogenes TaxID=67255 RepID=A0ABU0QE00_STRAH|nr:hypothetical protein [Streptomyces achromogenes]